MPNSYFVDVKKREIERKFIFTTRLKLIMVIMKVGERIVAVKND